MLQHAMATVEMRAAVEATAVAVTAVAVAAAAVAVTAAAAAVANDLAAQVSLLRDGRRCEWLRAPSQADPQLRRADTRRRILP